MSPLRRRASTAFSLLALAAALLLARTPAAAGILPVCGDGVVELPELCDDANTDDGDCCSSVCLPEPDVDLDGLCNGIDNCPLAWNPMQMDDDLDGIGDACDPCVDIDGDGLCHPDDTCPLDADPDDLDTDGDGLGDVCDPCTAISGSAAERGKLSASRLWEPLGNERVRYKATIIGLPEGQPFRPVTTGVRFLLEDGTGTVLWDVTVPGGHYDDDERRGWQQNDARTVFQYRGGEDEPGGIRKVKIKVLAGGALKLLLKARDATVLHPQAAPLTFTFVGTPPVGTSGYCAQGSFESGGHDFTRCVFMNGGERLVCK